jgi:hypothetical protein
MLLSDVAQRLLWLDGAAFSLRDYPMYRTVYDGRYKSTLLMCGRQVAKSTSLANFIITESVAIPFFKEYYVSPSKEQTLIFSNTRVGKTLSYSPLVKKHFQSPEHADRVLHRSYTNGSENAFTYACEDADRARGFSADRVCYDAEAQVLTREGWKLVKDVTQADVLADVDDEGVVRWSQPTDIVRKNHTGDMVLFKHRGFRLRVTGDHRMWVNFRVKPAGAYKQEDRYEFVSAIDLARTSRMGFKMTAAAVWSRGSAPDTVHFDGIPTAQGHERAPLMLKYRPFAQLVGWYVAEGHLQWRYYNGKRVRPQPVITQNAGRYLTEITALAKAAGLKYNITKPKDGDCCRLLLQSVALGHYFEPLGKAFDKYIPREFFDHPELLEEVLKGIYFGDASYHAGEAWDTGTLRTRSKRLAADVQEAWLRLGRAASIYERRMDGVPMYEVRPCKTDYMIFWRAEYGTKERVTVTPVQDEEVYCFTIKHHRPIVKGGFDSKPVIGSQCYDEFQDMQYDAVVPVINASMKNSAYRYETYAGTPKTMEASIQYLWDRSTQSEWVMKCSGCSKYNFVVSEASLGKHGPICLNCGTGLNPRTGQWVDMKRATHGERLIKGFHIPQPIMPANIALCNPGSTELQEAAQSLWDYILNDREMYSPAKFRNEVLGVSDAVGRRLISLEELQKLCVGPSPHPQPLQGTPHMEGVSACVAGVDWSGGGTTGVSRTVLWVWGFMPQFQKLKTLYYRIYPGNNAVVDVKDVIQVCQNYSVAMIVGDAGEGSLPNSMLREALGMHRVFPVQYGSFNKALAWNGVDRYLADRTTLIDNYMMYLKREAAIYPEYSHMMQPIQDILNVFEEVTTSGKKVWRHSPQLPDDCLHAQLFGWLAFKLMISDLKFYQ